jgi:hypothetical protein
MLRPKRIANIITGMKGATGVAVSMPISSPAMPPWANSEITP